MHRRPKKKTESWARGFCWLLLLHAASNARADTLSSGVFVRADTDHTVVVSPRAHVNKRWDTTQADVSYSADIWTSASIDIRASASLPVTEQRDELDFAVAHEIGDLTLSGSYRYSTENDYLSHGVTAGGSLDLADKNTTLALQAYAFDDTVGRSGAPTFARALLTGGLRLSATQVFGPATLGQLTYEVAHLDGYQASPYRFVGIGGTGFGCEAARYCLPEHEPDSRTRHALAAVLRHGLSALFSVGGSYRFYRDDWGLSSHTFGAQIGWLLNDQSSLTLRYRFYTQTAVNFYRAIYTQPSGPDGYTTRDREQSPMHNQRLGLEWEQKLSLAASGPDLVMHASVGGILFAYADFVGLSRVAALELTIALSLMR
jgi:hypothetical protein